MTLVIDIPVITVLNDKKLLPCHSLILHHKLNPVFDLLKVRKEVLTNLVIEVHP